MIPPSEALTEGSAALGPGAHGDAHWVDDVRGLELARSREWLRSFERQRGRPLRVLHIGNIANNAYNNAKIQRERNIDADVLSFDYYHIMASPEWEDADFAGKINDDFFPDWWAVDLKGFRRP